MFIPFIFGLFVGVAFTLYIAYCCAKNVESKLSTSERESVKYMVRREKDDTTM
jgi:hypothetical protein